MIIAYVHLVNCKYLKIAVGIIIACKVFVENIIYYTLGRMLNVTQRDEHTYYVTTVLKYAKLCRLKNFITYYYLNPKV